LIAVFSRRLIGPGLSQRCLIALQLFRVIGVLFIFENLRGNIPGVFAWPAGIGDALVSVLAAVVLWRYRRADIPPKAIYAVAILGIADFVSAFFFGFTSAASPAQLFSFAHPNPVDLYPTGLIPQFLVPFAFADHLLSLSMLRGRSKHTALAASAYLAPS